MKGYREAPVFAKMKVALWEVRPVSAQDPSAVTFGII
jgi:hypothetical protein